MNSSFISMVDKAKRYADDPQRISVTDIEVDLRGNNDTHHLALHDNHWSCGCDHFKTHALCAHVMAMQRVFSSYISSDARYTQERVPTAI